MRVVIIEFTPEGWAVLRHIEPGEPRGRRHEQHEGVEPDEPTLRRVFRFRNHSDAAWTHVVVTEVLSDGSAQPGTGLFGPSGDERGDSFYPIENRTTGEIEWQVQITTGPNRAFQFVPYYPTGVEPPSVGSIQVP
jgi:hypothetical protein